MSSSLIDARKSAYENNFAKSTYKSQSQIDGMNSLDEDDDSLIKLGEKMLLFAHHLGFVMKGLQVMVYQYFYFRR